MKRILVIEDNQPLSWLLQKILCKKYKVIIMNNGMEACSWLTEGNEPDLVICDINMPLMNGVELLENFKISGLHKNIPVIILSGVDDPVIQKKCERLGALAYLVKPFDHRKLLREVNRPLEQGVLI